MTDTSAPSVTAVSFNNTWKAVITISALLFNAAVIVYCVLKGDGANSLHSSAMAWSFATDVLVLAGLGIGSFTPDLIALMKGKS